MPECVGGCVGGYFLMCWWMCWWIYLVLVDKIKRLNFYSKFKIFTLNV
jgi:hypothetical protein|tara:strand:- start:136 stop:279 length:144 start_codon:yes stop_codon:yes gene_type:complete